MRPTRVRAARPAHARTRAARRDWRRKSVAPLIILVGYVVAIGFNEWRLQNHVASVTTVELAPESGAEGPPILTP